MPDTERLPPKPAATLTGNPIRPEIVTLAGQGYTPPDPAAPIRLLVTGGSQGARVFSEALPAALGRLPDALLSRLRIAQQCRPEDLERVRTAYAALHVEAELSPFFPDMAARLAAAHFVIARAGASTVAELAVAGRPALLVPFPHAIDAHQSFNARAVGADVLEQSTFQANPAILADTLAKRLGDPAGLATQAATIASRAVPDAAARLADLVEQTALQEIRV